MASEDKKPTMDMGGSKSSTKEVETKVATLDKWLDSFAGKPGMNPYLWRQKNLDPLLKRLPAQDAKDAIMALPDKPEPTIPEPVSFINQKKNL